MDVEARPPRQPPPNQGGFVGTVVVQDEMHVQFGGHRGVNGVEELPKLDAAVTPMQLTNHEPGLGIQGGAERRRAVSGVVVSPSLDLAGSHRQERLGPIQRLV